MSRWCECPQVGVSSLSAFDEAGYRSERRFVVGSGQAAFREDGLRTALSAARPPIEKPLGPPAKP